MTPLDILERLAAEGLSVTLKSKLDGKQEALLIALACSQPEDRENWTMQLLADKLVELKVVNSISDETVRRTLKKTTSSRGRRSSGVSAK
jgi:putative transposase